MTTTVKKKKGGFFSKLIIGFFVLVLIGVIIPDKDPDPNEIPSQTTQASAKPTATVKPTATPEPTATPVPDVSHMPIEQAAKMLAEYHGGSSFDFVSTFEIEGALELNVTLKPFLTEKTAVRDCCWFAINISEHIFKNPNVKSIIINFDTAGRDKYGNEITVHAMDILIYRSTATKINYGYMRDKIYSSTKAFLEITDRYFVHNDLRKGIN